MSARPIRPGSKPSPSHANARGQFINRYVNTIYELDPDGPAEHAHFEFWQPAWDYAYTIPHMTHAYWTEGMIDCAWDKLEPYMAMSIEELDAIIAIGAVPGTKATEPLFLMVCARACKEVP